MQKRYELNTMAVTKIVEYQSERGLSSQSDALNEILKHTDIAKMLKVVKK